MSGARRIVENRVGKIVVATVAAIAAGTAIPLYATGVFNSPPPACYLTSPTSGASVVGAQALNATCGASTANTNFNVDGQTVAASVAPFDVSWDSSTVGDGSHTLTVTACDGNGTCAQSASISFTTANAPHAPVNTVAPAVTGTAVATNTLTCSTGTWTGDTTGGFTFQWKDGNGNIAAATSATYVIGAGEIGLNVHCTVTATGASGSASADSNTLGPVASNSGLTTAHVWVSAAGNDATCQRNAALVSYATALAASPTNVCATGPKAYAKANLTDTVLVEGSPMTVTSQWAFTKATSKTATAGTCNYGYAGISSAQDLSNCVTIEPAAGQSLTFSIPNHAGNTYSPGGSPVFVCVDFLALENFTVNQTTYVDQYGDTDSDYGVMVGNADSTCNPNSVQPHDILIQNAVVGGGLDQAGGSFNTWFVGDTFRDVQNQAVNFTNGTYPCPGGGVAHNDGILNSIYLDTTFVFSDPAHHHGAVQHFTDTCSDAATNRFSNIVFAGNVLEGFCTPIALSCAEGLEVETSFDHLLIENNYFDNGQVDDIECVGSGCNNIDNTVRFNTFADGSYLQARQVCTTSCTGSIDGNVVYGNVNASCQTPAASNTSTSISGWGAATGTKWVYSYEVDASSKVNACSADSTGSYAATVTFVSKGAPNYNLDLSGAQTAVNFVPNSQVWPATNIHGAARSGATTNAGAD